MLHAIMKRMIKLTALITILKTTQGQKPNVSLKNYYVMPHENDGHEATWLSWPHQYEYGYEYRERLDATWIAMTKALCDKENVSIIAYDRVEKIRIQKLLKKNNVSCFDSISYYVYPTNDVWIRDNGPIFVRTNSNNSSSSLTILDWNFNGWGNKHRYEKDNVIPEKVGTTLKLPIVNLNDVMTLEGGAFEHDGRGTFLATKSAILNKNRNPSLTQQQVEETLQQFLGVSNFIWLDGTIGEDVTDGHIDGFARFATNNTIVTMKEKDLAYYYVSNSDIQKLYNAKDVNGKPYQIEYVPLTKRNVITTYGLNTYEKGSYCNFYVANDCVLIPRYNDDNDIVAQKIFEKIFFPRQVIPIDCRNVIVNGGMIHCITQQQPI